MLKFSQFSSKKFIFFILFCLNLTLLLYAVSNLSIGYDEARIYFANSGIISFITNLSCKIFSQNDFALRAPFVLIHLINSLLIYKIYNLVFGKFSPNDGMICASIYMFLPGVMTSAILVDSAGFVIFLTLLMIYFYERNLGKIFYFLLFCSAFLSSSFFMLYICFLMYAIYSKNRILGFLSLLLIIISLNLFGFNIGGKPRGYLLDTIGIFAAVFSPFLFLHFVYTIYRIAVKEKMNILWFISAGSFIVCLIFSIRQRLELEIFLPFCVIGVILMVKNFLNSYRVRLPQFRKKYKIVTSFVFLSFGFFCLTIVLNPLLYAILQNPKKNFAYDYDIAKDLSAFLLSKNITEIYVPNSEIALRIKFYGIKNDKFSKFKLVCPKAKRYENVAYKFELVKFGKQIANCDIVER